MKIKGIDHIAIVFGKCEDVLILWEKILGLKFEHEEILEKNGVRVYVMRNDGNEKEGPVIEMLEPYGENSPIINFLKKRGVGIHHICFKTDDIESDIRELKDKGVRLINEKPVEGANGSLIIFIEPKELGGILVELKQEKIE
mgnify:CR=1 FL=1